MKKKLVSLLVIGSMAAVMLAGCGNSSGGNANTNDGQNTAQNTESNDVSSAETENDDVSDAQPAADTSGMDFGDYSADNPLELKLSHFAGSDTNQLAILANTFAEYVEADTNGAVKVTVYGGGTLGNDQESLDSVIAGTLDCAVNNTPIMSGYSEGLSVLDLPYLFENYDDIYAFLNSDVCQQMKDDFSEKGAYILNLQCVGFRNLESSKGFVKTPEDLAGLKIRVTGSDVYVNTWNTWGANALTMPGNEVLTALQQGTIDACDNTNNTCFADGYQEYAKSISIMEYATHFNGITMNKAKFDSLTADLQSAILASAKRAADDCTKNLETLNEQNLQDMVDSGAEVSEDVDKEAFKKASESVYSDFTSGNAKGAEYYEAIQALLK